MLKPRGLTEMKALALEMAANIFSRLVSTALEQEGKVTKPSYGSQFRTTSVTTNRFRNGGGSRGHSRVSKGVSSIASSNPAHKGRINLSDAEYEDRKKRGLCYKCDERYFVGHNCKSKELQVFVLLNGCEVELVDGCLVDADVRDGEQLPEYISLSLNAFLGTKSPSTTKLQGHIGRLAVIVMLDSGATHNFITPTAVKRAKLRMLQDLDVEIMLGTGVAVKNIGHCKNVQFELGGFDFEADFIALELGSADVILGIQWLRTLGNCQINWDSHELSFVHHGQQVTFVGNKPISLEKSVLQVLISEYRTGDNVLVMDDDTEDDGIFNSLQVCPELAELLMQFPMVFEEPTSLPPVRGRELAITLVEGTSPISVRPYRYPHAHKEEMERLVKNMLEAGTIRLSRSPYSSPVLLVQKKDTTWRFCVDYGGCCCDSSISSSGTKSTVYYRTA